MIYTVIWKGSKLSHLGLININNPKILKLYSWIIKMLTNAQRSVPWQHLAWFNMKIVSFYQDNREKGYNGIFVPMWCFVQLYATCISCQMRWCLWIQIQTATHLPKIALANHQSIKMARKEHAKPWWQLPRQKKGKKVQEPQLVKMSIRKAMKLEKKHKKTKSQK